MTDRAGSLDALVERLLPGARSASRHAYAPHSGYHVGAAALDRSGQIHCGCNVESDSYGLTQCAERNALGSAITAGVRRGEIDALLVYLPGLQALAPCGACRQVMVELLAEGAWIMACCDGPDRLAWRREELMPDAFIMPPGEGPGK